MGRKASTINLSEDERLYLETQMRARTIQAPPQSTWTDPQSEPLCGQASSPRTSG